MRVRRLMATIAACVALIIAPAAAASATDPVALGQDYVLDDAGVLDPGQVDAAQTRLRDLYTATGVDLYVVFVDTFTNPSDRQDWADDVADAGGLGRTQYLLAVATESRQFTISALDDGPVTGDQLDRIEAQIKPKLSAGDYSGAITTAADGFRSALEGAGGGGGGVLTVVLILLVIVVAIVVIVVLVRARRRKRAAGATGPALQRLDLTELARRAGTALVEADDAVRTSEQELGFARAQFGDDATTEFGAALAQAKADLDEAFALKQKLDDAVPDTDEEKRAWNTQIVELCERAEKGLDEKAAAFDELRKLEQNAPEALAKVQQLREEGAGAMDAADTRLRELTAAYAPEALTTVADNVDQARQRLQFADQQLAAAQQAITAGDGGQAAVAIRAAEQAADQARQLQQAVETLASDLDDGEKQAAALVQELEGDIASASALPDADGAVARVMAATRTQVDAAKADIAGTRRHPLATLKALQAVNAQIDQVTQGVRDAEARRQRAAQQLGTTILQAQAQVSAAEDYLTSRRGAIGADARTRLAQAGAELVQAQQLQPSDPDQALQHAQRADQLAGLALQAAQSDVGGYGQSGGSSGDTFGAVLGGILVGSLLNGSGSGRRSSGFGGFSGGTRRSGGFGGFGGGGRSSGRSPGSFGGGGTRSRRGGGRF